jgi:hypothetical protein
MYLPVAPCTEKPYSSHEPHNRSTASFDQVSDFYVCAASECGRKTGVGSAPGSVHGGSGGIIVPLPEKERPKREQDLQLAPVKRTESSTGTGHERPSCGTNYQHNYCL